MIDLKQDQAHLKGLGLIRNTGQGQLAGLSNAWTITAKGQALMRAVSLKSGQARSLR